MDLKQRSSSAPPKRLITTKLASGAGSGLSVRVIESRDHATRPSGSVP
jgi:hypothetical protein